MRQGYIFTSKWLMFDSSDDPALAKLRVDEYYNKGKGHSLRKMSSFLLEIYVRLINGYVVHEKRKLFSLYLDKLSNFCLLFQNRQLYH